MLPEKQITINCEIPLSSKNEGLYLAIAYQFLNCIELPNEIIYMHPYQSIFCVTSMHSLE
jgi:hypothetical protein